MTTGNLPAFSDPDVTPEEARRITEYCNEEVRRQYYGKEPPVYAVPGMLEAWGDALHEQFLGNALTPDLIRRWGQMIEPGKNAAGFRGVPVFVGWNEKMNYTLIDRAIYGLCRMINDGSIEALVAYRDFEEIHPFIDGNGRTGKIILNWVNGTLIDPIFPPDDFWGRVLVNP